MMIFQLLCVLVVCVRSFVIDEDDLIEELLSYHNIARSKVQSCEAVARSNTLLPPAAGMPDLEWDEDLATTASDYASKCGIVGTKKTSGCQHSGPMGWKPSGGWAAAGFTGGVGENIGCPQDWKPFSDNKDYWIHAWYDTSMIDNELARYRWKKQGETNCYTKVKGVWAWRNSGCSHYTQDIDERTRLMGCGWASCDKGGEGGITGDWMVCHYYPSGNFRDTYPYSAVGTCGGVGDVITTTKDASTCVQISGFGNKLSKTGNNLNKLNGLWCQDLDNAKLFIKDGDSSMKINWSTGMKEWNVKYNWKLYGWCQKTSLWDCDGVWQYQNSAGDYVNAGVGTSFDTLGGSSSAASTGPSPTKPPTTKPPTSKPTTTTTASSRKCVEMSGMPAHTTKWGNYLPDMNGQWTETGTNTNQYAKNGISLVLKYNSNQGQWRVGNGWKPWGFCAKSNILNCDGKWEYQKKSQSGTYTAGNTRFFSCGALEIDDFPCFANYSSAYKFYLNDSHSGYHFSRVDGAGCEVNNAPQWAYIDEESGVSLRLTYHAEAEWRIHDEGSYMYQWPKYVCYKQDATECSQGWWQQLVPVQVINETAATGAEGVSTSNNTEWANVTVSRDITFEIEFVVVDNAHIVSVDTVSASSTKEDGKATVYVAIGALIVLLVVVMVVVGCVIHKKRKTALKNMETIADDDEAAGQAETVTMM